jgi:hypothetical protein
MWQIDKDRWIDGTGLVLSIVHYSDLVSFPALLLHPSFLPRSEQRCPYLPSILGGVCGCAGVRVCGCAGVRACVCERAEHYHGEGAPVHASPEVKADA